MKINNTSKRALLASSVAIVAVAGLGGVSQNVFAAENDNSSKVTSVINESTISTAINKEETSKFTKEEKAVIDAKIATINGDRQEFIKKAISNGDWQPYYAFEYTQTPGYFEVTKMKDKDGKDKYVYERNKVYYGWMLESHLSNTKNQPDEQYMKETVALFNAAPGMVPYVVHLNNNKELANKYDVPQVDKDFFDSRFNNPDLLKGLIPTSELIVDSSLETQTKDKIEFDKNNADKDTSVSNGSTNNADKNNSTIDKNDSNKENNLIENTNIESKVMKDISISVGETVKYNLDEYFVNPDKTLNYDVEINGDNAGEAKDVEATLKNSILSIKTNKSGNYDVKIKASNGKEKQFKITVSNAENRIDVKTMPNLKASIAMKETWSNEIDLNIYFTDKEGEKLKFDVDVKGVEGNVTVSEDNSKLTLIPATIGENTINITATAVNGETSKESFTFNVEKDGNSKENTVKKEVKKLPQTGNESNGLTGVIGVMLIGLASVLGIRKKR